MRRVLACLVAALTLGLGAGATTASAQVGQTGLVNLNLEDVTVQVPIGLAANVCDVNVAVIATVVDAGNATRCNAVADATAMNIEVGGPPDNPVTQTGLVNVNIQDVTVQVPIAAALNICDVNAAILAVLIDTSNPTCTADASSHAKNKNG